LSASEENNADDLQATLHCAHSCSRAYIHEVGLYGLVQGRTPSVTRISIIYECYSASMKHLSRAVEVPLDEMSRWGIMEWRQLNLSLMLCAKSSIVLDSTYCTVESSQRANWLGKCLDTLTARAKELYLMTVGNMPAGQDHDHFLKRIANEWSNAKACIRTCVQQNQPDPQISTSTQQYQALMSWDSSFDFDSFNDAYWLGMPATEVRGLNTSVQL